MTESWKPVVGYEGLYEVSDLGRIRSLDRVTKGQNHYGRVISLVVGTNGYLYVTLCASPRPKKLFTVHTLVLAAFVGPRPEGMLSRHLNGDRSDARLANLRYGTQVENMADMLAHGNNYYVNKTHCKQGHPLSGDNLIQTPRQRICKTCSDASKRRYKQRKREEAQVAS